MDVSEVMETLWVYSPLTPVTSGFWALKMWLFNSGAELLILFILINLNLSNMWLVATLLDSRVKCGMSLALTFFITKEVRFYIIFQTKEIFGNKQK